jgi:hypothetical protein
MTTLCGHDKRAALSDCRVLNFKPLSLSRSKPQLNRFVLACEFLVDSLYRHQESDDLKEHDRKVKPNAKRFNVTQKIMEENPERNTVHR